MFCFYSNMPHYHFESLLFERQMLKLLLTRIISRCVAIKINCINFNKNQKLTVQYFSACEKYTSALTDKNSLILGIKIHAGPVAS